MSSSETSEGIIAKALCQSQFKELSGDVEVKRWLSLLASRDKFEALWGEDGVGVSRTLRGLGLRETKALSSAEPKPGGNVLLCALMCLNNLIKRGGTR